MRQSIKAIAAIAITSGLLADTDPCFTKAFTHLYLVEFVDGNHPRRHWHAADGGHHVEVQS